jgi:para-aminobenzoate synthetase/4-amino-4-deoxychorismate lyase
MSGFRVLAGLNPVLAFENPLEVLRTKPGEDSRSALAAAESALRGGNWIAGVLRYDGSLALGVFDAPHEADLEDGGGVTHSPLLPLVGRARYDAAIASLRRAIFEGDVYQVNYTVPFELALHGDAVALYSRYARRTGAKYQAFVEDGDRAILSWSPELFLEFDGTRVFTKPMKGTAPLDRVDELQNAKNRAEHLMIVDLLRNDLHRVCANVEVEELFALERYPTFATMTSTIAGTLRDGIVLADIFEAAFPCGSVTGAPKRAAMQFIAANETRAREAYCGSIGFLSPQRRGWWNVAIRTAQIDTVSGTGRFDAGGGIVADSTAAEEWDELRLKARFLDDPEFAILETFASDVDDTGLDAHVERMAGTASVFGVAGAPSTSALRLASLAQDDKGARDDTSRRSLIRLRLHSGGRLERLVEGLDESDEPVRICLASARVRSDDPFLRYKTTWRPAHDAAASEARAHGCFDALLQNERGDITEGWRTNLFFERDGELWTPPAADGVLPGILRSRLVSEGRVRERSISAEELQETDAIYIGNSARGLLRALLITT